MLEDTWDTPEDNTTRYKDPDKIRKLTNAHETVFQMWEQGIRDLHEIEMETSYSTSYIRQLLRKRGYEVSTAHLRSTDEVKAICADYVSGMKIKDILKKYDISNNTLYSFLDEQAVPIRLKDPGAKRGRREFLDGAVRMYQEGFPVKDIVVETNITPSVLYQELAIREIPLRGHHEPNGPVTDMAIQMYQDKVPIADIVNETGVSSSKLYKELRVRDVPIYRGSDLHARLAQAVTMYQTGSTVETIYKETKINTTMLYRELHRQGISLRNRAGGRAQGQDLELAYRMYDQGAKAFDITKASNISTTALVEFLKQRGQHLRTGLSTRVTARSVEYAVRGYESGLDFDTIEIDTLVTRPQLLAELSKRGIALRP